MFCGLLANLFQQSACHIGHRLPVSLIVGAAVFQLVGDPLRQIGRTQQCFFLCVRELLKIVTVLNMLPEIIPQAFCAVQFCRAAAKCRGKRQRPLFQRNRKMVLTVFAVQIALIAVVRLFFDELAAFFPAWNASSQKFFPKIIVKLM